VRRYTFVGRLSIDLAATREEGETWEFEALETATDLRRWLSACPLAVDGVEVSADDLAIAKALRRAIWDAFDETLEHGGPRAADLAVINGMAGEPPLVPALNGLDRTWREPTAVQAFSDIARDAIALLSDPKQLARLRRCENPDCERMFYDASRPGRRRWCSTTRCGDRMRSRAYRSRHQP